MAGKVNLIRDARVFFTSNVDEYGKIQDGGEGKKFTDDNTFEIQVLDGLSLTQNTGTETVSISEAGQTPVRGSRTFNTSLEALDFSFSTYMRPSRVGTAVTAEEACLWNAFTSDKALGTNGTGNLEDAGWEDGTAGDGAGEYAKVDWSSSDKNQLQRFGIILSMKSTTILIHNCALDSVTLDFAIDGIATLQWAGKGTEFEQFGAITINATTSTSDTSQKFYGGFLGTGAGATAAAADNEFKRKLTQGVYLVNRLSAATVKYPATNGTDYIIPITAGNLTMSNNLTYLTPATVGVINKPITYFTGARTFSGSLTAYLRKTTGTNGTDTGALFNKVLETGLSSDTNQANLTINVGGTNSTTERVDILVPTALLQIPSIATEQVVTATFGFTPQGSEDIESTDELEIRYFHKEAPTT